MGEAFIIHNPISIKIPKLIYSDFRTRINRSSNVSKNISISDLSIKPGQYILELHINNIVSSGGFYVHYNTIYYFETDGNSIKNLKHNTQEYHYQNQDIITNDEINWTNGVSGSDSFTISQNKLTFISGGRYLYRDKWDELEDGVRLIKLN